MAIGVRVREREGKQTPTRAYSSKQEKRVAKVFGGQRTPNSGATAFSKGDVKLENYLIECKTKTSDSQQITIHKEWLTKLREEAVFMGKPYEALMFNFGPSDTKNYVVIDEDTFKELIEKHE